MSTVEETLDSVVQKQSYVEETYNTVTELLEHCRSLQRSFAAINGTTMDVDQKSKKATSSGTKIPSVAEGIESLVNLCSEGSLEAQFTAGQTAYHHSLNRFQKAFEHDYPPSAPEMPLNHIQLSSSDITPLISSYLLRTGRIETAQQMCPSLTSQEVEPYVQLRTLIASLRAREVDPILDWIATEPQHVDSASLFDLSFKLRKLHFGNLIKSKSSNEALQYAKEHFMPFMGANREEMHKLLGALAFLPSIEEPIYRDLVGSTVLMKAEELLAQLFCRSKGLPSDAHLLTLVRASSHALPCLSKAIALSSSIHVPNGHSHAMQMDGLPTTLPFEIPLPKDFIFHSLFCCPVSKEISSPNNPPQLLPCGHVLSKDIVTDLSKGRASYRSANAEAIHPFKCPYCPEKVQVAQVKTINFD